MTTVRCLSNQADRDNLVGRRGGAGILSWFRAGVSVVQLVFSQSRVAEAGRKRGAEKTTVMRMWSDPVLGRGDDNEAKKGTISSLAKERSSTAGLSLEIRGKPVKTP